MPKLEEFQGKHAGQDIYIIASGASCNFIDPDFFKDKITIGINQVYKRFPLTYCVRKEHKFLRQSLHDSSGCLMFVSKHDCGNVASGTTVDKAIAPMTENEIRRLVIYSHNHNKHTTIDGLPASGLVTSYSTITTGMHLAAFMGAKTIILVGHDCGTLDDVSNFNEYHTKDTLHLTWKHENDYKNWLYKIEEQSIRVKQLLKEKYGCAMYSLNPFINFGLEGHAYKGVRSK